MSEKTLYCRICRQAIGLFESDRLSWPIDPAVFTSLDPEHGWPAPFLRGVDWENAICPYCRKPPYYWTEPSIVLTDAGEVDAKLTEKRASEVVHCRYCGEGPFPNYQARVAHERNCDARGTNQ